MEIKSISKKNLELIRKCVKLADTDYFDNIVLLGDLFPPCIKLTDIYGIFNDNTLISFFTVFKGFKVPSVVLPSNLSGIESFILSNLDKIIHKEFTLVSFTLSRNNLINHYQIKDESSEYCMITDQTSFTPKTSDLIFKQVTKDNINRIDRFYRAIDTYPWNPIQIESNFYFYFEKDNKIIACGGTHFETPDVAHLGNIIVLAEFRGQSLGSALVSTITSNILRSKSYATLFVTQDNLPAINLYKKLGFFHHKPVSIFSCKRTF
ncbi:MAG: GNAT family N-acetyltransferase [Candidatus Heimdallarchaeota archaeon]|nr:MAG: GNAT family N-acetyltransferase [Candidatus Heimdallarchaeota archaeon]